MSKWTFGLIDIDPDYLVKLDEHIRAKVRAPTFPLKSQIYRKVRRAKSYRRVNGMASPRRPVPISGLPVTVSEALELGRILGTSPAELQKHVEYVKTGRAANARILRARLPVEPDRKYAFLIGLFHAAGCINYREKDPMIRFAVDSGMVPTLEKIGAEIGEVPHVDWHLMARLRGEAWTRKRVYVCYSFILKGILEKFGLFTGHGKRLGRGRWRSAREIDASVPWWIVKSRRNMHAYVEGYLSSMKTQVVAHRTRAKGLPNGYVLVVFSGMNRRQLRTRAGLVKAYMERRGIDVHWRPSTRDPGRLPEMKLGIYSKDAVRRFSKVFKIDSVYTSSKLRLIVRSSQIQLKMLQAVESTTDASVLGLIMKEPMTMEEAGKVLRMRTHKLERAVSRLSSASLLRKGANGMLSCDTRAFAVKTATNLVRRHALMSKAVADSGMKLFYKCAVCDTVVEKPRHCRRPALPIPRQEVLRGMTHSAMLGLRTSRLLLEEVNAR